MRKVLVLLLPLLCTACIAQSKYNNQLEPGLSTLQDANQALGQPVRMISPTMYEYSAPAGASRLVVELRSGGSLINRIEAEFLQSYARAALLEALKMPASTRGKVFVRDGMLMEVFDEPVFLAFTYTLVDGANKVEALGYYSRQLFSESFGAFRNMPELLDQPGVTPGTASAVTPGLRQPAMPGTTPIVSGGLAAPTAAQPSNSGQSSGVINWSGKLEKDQVVTIEGLPGFPVVIDLNTKEFSIVEPPSPANNWKRLVVRSRSRKNASVIAVKWTVIPQ